MPELPEVEIVCRNLSNMIKPAEAIKRWTFFRADLRFDIPQKQLQKIIGKPLVKIERRAKYILFNFGSYTVISHLGMTGSWREVGPGWVPKKHDHLAFEISNGRSFVFEDPRRFGFIEVLKSESLCKRFSTLGVEPLDKKTDFKELTQKYVKLNSPIKTAIMNQKIIVGVGNIYASEVLFRAEVNPLKICSKISTEQYKKIWNELISVLSEAIEKGGSTIENYRNGFGEKGSFQKSFFVYGKKSEECLKCHTPIKHIVQAGRSTFWCPHCQKK